MPRFQGKSTRYFEVLLTPSWGRWGGSGGLEVLFYRVRDPSLNVIESRIPYCDDAYVIEKARAVVSFSERQGLEQLVAVAGVGGTVAEWGPWGARAVTDAVEARLHVPHGVVRE